MTDMRHGLQHNITLDQRFAHQPEFKEFQITQRAIPQSLTPQPMMKASTGVSCSNVPDIKTLLPSLALIKSDGSCQAAFQKIAGLVENGIADHRK